MIYRALSLVAALRESLRWVQLSGPTLFAPVINQVSITHGVASCLNYWEVTLMRGRLLLCLLRSRYIHYCVRCAPAMRRRSA